MLDAAAFQQEFGAALAGRLPVDNPALARALLVHRNTAARAVQGALADNYPVTRAIVGDEAFAAAAAAFVDHHPPTEPRLCFYGEHFAAFVANYVPFAELPYLSDVAAVERLTIEALFAADAPALDGDAFADVIDLERPLTLHPATRFAVSSTPAAAIWQAHQPDAPVDALDDLAWTEELVLITRPADGLIVTVLPPSAVPFLAACADARPLGEAASAVAEADLAPLFATLVAVGTFA